MMDLSKQYDFFQPDKDQNTIHIIGAGSVGSTIAENLARCGVKNIELWDFDIVETHNIVNQMFRAKDLGKTKVDALKEIILEINPEIESKIKVHPKGWNGEMLSGYVFLAVDSIELRRKIVEKHMNNIYVKAMFDVRTLLTGAQHFCAVWNSMENRKNFLDTMQFSDEDAESAVPVSACGRVLGVVTTVRIISAYAVNNYIKVVKGEKPWKFLQFDGFNGTLDAFE